MTKPFPDGDVAGRLKAIRTANCLSQRQLSARSGVSNATISQIESGAINPTVSMLKKVLSGIPMSLSDFFTYGSGEPEQKIFYGASELIEISKGGVSFRQIGGNLQGRSIQLLKERYEPGANTGRLALRHEGEECGYVLSGKLKVTVAGQSRILHAGDAYYFKSDNPHSFRNDSDEPCELVTACTPPTF